MSKRRIQITDLQKQEIEGKQERRKDIHERTDLQGRQLLQESENNERNGIEKG